MAQVIGEGYAAGQTYNAGHVVTQGYGALVCLPISSPITIPGSSPTAETVYNNANPNYTDSKGVPVEVVNFVDPQSGSDQWPAGCYQIVYVQGAVNWNENVPNTYWSARSVVTDSAGNDIYWPGEGGPYYTSQADVEALYGSAVGYTAIPFAHVGGTIGVALTDGLVTDNGPGSPSTTFALITPCLSQIADPVPDVTVLTHPIYWFRYGYDQVAGPYRIGYSTGAYEYDPTPGHGWTVQGNYPDAHPVDPDYPQMPGFYITDNDQTVSSNQLPAAGNQTNYDTQSDCASGNAGLAVIYNHNGGPIGVWLDDFPVWDNVNGQPSPGWFMCGPGPIIEFTATPPSGIAGASYDLAWSVEYSASQSIDNGIGSVGASGRTTVTPSETTTYTLSATGYATQGAIPISAAVTIVVEPPQAPTDLAANQCGGEVTLSWTPGLYCSSQQVERSVDNATWSALATLDSYATTYVDATATPGDPYYYRVVGAAGTATAPSASIFTFAYVEPDAVQNLTVATNALTAVLAWSAPANYDPYFAGWNYAIYRDGVQIATTDETAFTDYGPLANDTEYTWTVYALSPCAGVLSAGVTVSATPEQCLNAFSGDGVPDTVFTATAQDTDAFLDDGSPGTVFAATAQTQTQWTAPNKG